MTKVFLFCKNFAKYDILSLEQNLSIDIMLIYFLPKQTLCKRSLYWEEIHLLIINIYGTMPIFNFSSQLKTDCYYL